MSPIVSIVSFLFYQLFLVFFVCFFLHFLQIYKQKKSSTSNFFFFSFSLFLFRTTVLFKFFFLKKQTYFFFYKTSYNSLSQDTYSSYSDEDRGEYDATDKDSLIIHEGHRHVHESNHGNDHQHHRKTHKSQTHIAGFKINTLGLALSKEEKEQMDATEKRLLKIEHEEIRNNEELDKVMKKAKEAQKLAEKHMSFREKSIKAREDKKAAERAATGGAFDLLKKVFVIIIGALVIVALLAILGCEMGVDGLKESFVCTIGKPPPDDRRLIGYLRGWKTIKSYGYGN